MSILFEKDKRIHGPFLDGYLPLPQILPHLAPTPPSIPHLPILPSARPLDVPWDEVIEGSTLSHSLLTKASEQASNWFVFQKEGQILDSGYPHALT